MTLGEVLDPAAAAREARAQLWAEFEAKGHRDPELADRIDHLDRVLKAHDTVIEILDRPRDPDEAVAEIHPSIYQSTLVRDSVIRLMTSAYWAGRGDESQDPSQ